MIGSTHIAASQGDDPMLENTPEPSAPSMILPDMSEPIEWLECDAPPPSRWRRWLAALCGLALAGWTALFIAIHATPTATPAQWLGWIEGWSAPVAVLGIFWLLLRPTNGTQAAQFNENAQRLQQDATALEARLTAVNAELSIAREFLAAQTRDLEALGRQACERLSQSGSELAALILDNSAQITAIGSVSIAALDNMEALRAQLPVLTNSAKDVANTIGTAGRQASDQVSALTQGMERLESLGSTGEARIAALRDTLAEASARGQDLADHLGTANDSVAASIGRIGAFHTTVDNQATAHAALLEAMRQSLEMLDSQSTELVNKANHELTGSLARLHAAALSAGSAIREQGGQAVADIAAQLGEESISAIERAIRNEAAALTGQLEQAASHAAGVAREAGAQIAEQVAKVDALVANLEARVAEARAAAEAQIDHGFARRAALITDALNSSAVDIAKALDSTIADTAWAAYLKGDRGIFTRTAVRLLDSGESKAVAKLYRNDDAFRDRVSHYIHDFEGMLREILSTRDGAALGVTLLSSDMGKLYVALAQAIERLRS